MLGVLYCCLLEGQSCLMSVNYRVCKHLHKNELLEELKVCLVSNVCNCKITLKNVT